MLLEVEHQIQIQRERKLAGPDPDDVYAIKPTASIESVDQELVVRDEVTVKVATSYPASKPNVTVQPLDPEVSIPPPSPFLPLNEVGPVETTTTGTSPTNPPPLNRDQGSLPSRDQPVQFLCSSKKERMRSRAIQTSQQAGPPKSKPSKSILVQTSLTLVDIRSTLHRSPSTTTPRNTNDSPRAAPPYNELEKTHPSPQNPAFKAYLPALTKAITSLQSKVSESNEQSHFESHVAGSTSEEFKLLLDKIKEPDRMDEEMIARMHDGVDGLDKVMKRLPEVIFSK
ncbi:hypothetical protein T439DRAFT_84855 [Meredithblackwellia eburnea MCA 4105]